VADPSGRLHAAGLTQPGTSTSTTGLVYATCATGCDSSSNWSSVVLAASHRLTLLSLRVLPDGRPRIMADLTYYECDAGCLSAASWRSVALPPAPHGYLVQPQFDGHHFFALSATGGTAVVFTTDYDSTVYVARCPSSCSQATQWWVMGNVASSYFFTDPNVVFLPTGGLALSSRTMDTSGSTIRYRVEYWEQNPGNLLWSSVELVNSTNDLVQELTLDAQGRPRLAVLFPDGTDPAHANSVSLYSCDSGCTTLQSWHALQLPMKPSGGGRQAFRLSLATGSGDAMRLAYRNSDVATLATCSAGCSAGAQPWTSAPILTSGQLNHSLPFTRSCATSTWSFQDGVAQLAMMPGGGATLLLDATALQNDARGGQCPVSATYAANEFRSLVLPLP
jgi:hypothetical protein